MAVRRAARCTRYPMALPNIFKERTAPVQPDRINPTTVDAGEARPLSVSDLHMALGLQEMSPTTAGYLSLLANFVIARTGLTAEDVANMEAKAFFHLATRVAVVVRQRRTELDSHVSTLKILLDDDDEDPQ